MYAHELLEVLQDICETDPGAEVRLATQPAWPMEHTIDRVHVDTVDALGIVYLVEGEQLGYLPEIAKTELWW